MYILSQVYIDFEDSRCYFIVETLESEEAPDGNRGIGFMNLAKQMDGF